MTRHTTRHFAPTQLLGSLAFALVAGAAGGHAMAADTSTSDAQQRYKADVERCRSGQTSQDEKTCLREAGAALQEARHNRLVRDPGSHERNQQARCDRLSGTQRDDCMQLMSDTSPQIQGSVDGGGIIRQTTITVPGDTAAPGSYPPGNDGLSPAAPASSSPAPAPMPSTPNNQGNMGTGTTGTSSSGAGYGSGTGTTGTGAGGSAGYGSTTGTTDSGASGAGYGSGTGTTSTGTSGGGYGNTTGTPSTGSGAGTYGGTGTTGTGVR